MNVDILLGIVLGVVLTGMLIAMAHSLRGRGGGPDDDFPDM